MTERLSFSSSPQNEEVNQESLLENSTTCFFPSQGFSQDHEIQFLEDQIYQMTIDECFSKANGLPHSLYVQIKKMKMSDSKKNCAICINQFLKGDIIKKLPCNHIFHNECAKPWFKRNIHCPVCRFDLMGYFKQKKL